MSAGALCLAVSALLLAACTTSPTDDGSGDEQTFELTLAHSYTEAQPQHRCGAQVIADVTSLKIGNVTGRAVDMGTFVYPITFTLRDVVFEDLRGLPAEALRPAYASMVGQDLPVAAICEIRDRATAILRDAGYVAAVEVPEQRIADGVVRFQVLMAKLVALRVRGDAGRAERRIASYLERLTEAEVFNRHEAERYLLLAGDLPGYTIRLALRSAGTARGEVIGEVTVARIPVLVDFTVQNYGSRELGRWGGLLRSQFFGLTGLGDRTSIAFFATPDFSEQQTVQVAHDFRVGGEGLAFGGQLTYAWASPDLGDPLIDIDSQTLFATVEANYPLVRRQALTLRGAYTYAHYRFRVAEDPEISGNRLPGVPPVVLAPGQNHGRQTWKGAYVTDPWDIPLEEKAQQLFQANAEALKIANVKYIFSGLFWSGEQAVELGLADKFGNLDFVAREVVKAEEVIDYTPQENIAERLVKRFGASIGAGAVRALHGIGGLR